eukprot:5364826-Prorocentrum_lima.AAC.1
MHGPPLPTSGRFSFPPPSGGSSQRSQPQRLRRPQNHTLLPHRPPKTGDHVISTCLQHPPLGEVPRLNRQWQEP